MSVFGGRFNNVKCEMTLLDPTRNYNVAATLCMSFRATKFNGRRIVAFDATRCNRLRKCKWLVIQLSFFKVQILHCKTFRNFRHHRHRGRLKSKRLEKGN